MKPGICLSPKCRLPLQSKGLVIWKLVLFLNGLVGEAFKFASSQSHYRPVFTDQLVLIKLFNYKEGKNGWIVAQWKPLSEGPSYCCIMMPNRGDTTYSAHSLIRMRSLIFTLSQIITMCSSWFVFIDLVTARLASPSHGYEYFSLLQYQIWINNCLVGERM